MFTPKGVFFYSSNPKVKVAVGLSKFPLETFCQRDIALFVSCIFILSLSIYLDVDKSTSKNIQQILTICQGERQSSCRYPRSCFTVQFMSNPSAKPVQTQTSPGSGPAPYPTRPPQGSGGWYRGSSPIWNAH